MTDPRLIKTWKAAEAQLRIAETFLNLQPNSPVTLDHSLHDYQEFVASNELGLAMDELEALALESGAKPAFWRWLSKAASMMQHDTKVRVYEARFHDALENNT